MTRKEKMARDNAQTISEYEAITGKCYACRTKGHLSRDHDNPAHPVNLPPDTYEQWRAKQDNPEWRGTTASERAAAMRKGWKQK